MYNILILKIKQAFPRNNKLSQQTCINTSKLTSTSNIKLIHLNKIKTKIYSKKIRNSILNFVIFAFVHFILNLIKLLIRTSF